jgi:crotonobetainyl-CoA:carnitine CoA-transferase CaiB-like acyl-CoA transferase
VTDAILGRARTLSLDEVLVTLDAADVPGGRVYIAADLAADPHYQARGMITRDTLPHGQSIDLPGIVPELSETPGATRWVGPALGEHTSEVLRSIGVTEKDLVVLRLGRRLLAATAAGAEWALS